MEIKKHNINIGIDNSQFTSDFVLDLRQSNDKLVALKDDQISSIASLREHDKNSLSSASDWLNNISSDNKTKNKIKTENKINNFFSYAKFKQRINIQLLFKKIASYRQKLSSSLNDFILRKKQLRFLHKFDYSRRELWRDRSQKIDDAFIKKNNVNAKKKKTWFLIFSFLLILLVLILPFKIISYYRLWEKKDAVMNGSEDALAGLLSAGTAASELDLSRATVNFSAAGNKFLAAADDLGNMDELISVLTTLSGDQKVKMAGEAKNFLNIGVSASNLGRNLSLAFDIIFSQKTDDAKIEPLLKKFIYYGQAAIEDAGDLNKNLAKIKISSIPAEYQEKFTALKTESLVMERGLVDFVNLISGLDDFLGANKDRRYLVVFQNNSEARASGGFIGSYALLDLREGKIKNIEVPAGGSYDTEGGLRVLVEAPQPLQLVDPLWHFWDANWWSDWRLSAKNLMWFYEKSDGSSVDGVISFTPTVLERLLTITGPIDMSEDYGLIIDSNNFWESTQSVVEKIGNPELYSSSTPMGEKLISSVKNNINLETAEKNKPKKIIGDLINKIMAILPTKISKENIANLFSVVDQSLNEKQILFYFNDEKMQKKIEDNSWAGAIKDAPNDYLSVVNTNIAGGKSDRKIKQQISHSIEVQTDDSIIDTLTITRDHAGEKGELFSGVRNVDWLRVYVPRGSELISADGFKQPDAKYFDETPDPNWLKNDLLQKTEYRAVTDAASGVKIYDESGKTVFANWVMTDPGQSSVITFKYRLPFKLRSTRESNDFLFNINNWLNTGVPVVFKFSLLVQKQPGAFVGDFISNFKINDNRNIFWKYPNNLAIMANGWSFKADLDSDKYYSILIK